MANNPKNKIRNPKLLIKFKAIGWLLAKFVIAFAIVTILISGNCSSFISSIKGIQPGYLVLGLIFYGLIQCVAAFRWYLLLKIQGIRVSFFETFSLSMQGLFFSLVIPGGAIGGDLVRSGFLISRTPKGNRLAATSTIFMDRFLGMIAQFSISLFFALFFIPQISCMAKPPKFTIVLILIISALGLLAGFVLFAHRIFEKIPLFSFLIKIIDRPAKGFVSESMRVMDIYNADKKTMLKCVLISIFLFQIGMSFVLFLIAKGLHSHDISMVPLILSIALGNTAGLLPITPGGLGTRDAVVKATLNAGGFSSGEAIAMPLLFSALMVTTSLVGGFFFLFHKRGKENYEINHDEKILKNDKACFLDRDGVLIEEKNYISSPSEVVLFPQTILALKALKENGFKIIVITNQGGVAKGYYREENIDAVHREIDHQLAKFNIKIDKYYYCPHHPAGVIKEYSVECTCRKPAPGLILEAVREFGIDIKRSFLIGDKISDIDAAKNAGCHGILVRTGYGRDYEKEAEKKGIDISENILEAVNLFIKSELK